ncbi:unnamed protein product [Miscanthus lutarioriparius]|uniref:Uncharacterized protein n=1 Tax=Miscanthus lutarioriparius TaxID=422564 RepID=A0A811SEM4_9POAL|nr:unnamed protein product [Miscanthus lutarioriparius]
MDRSNVAAAGAVSVDVRGGGGSPPAGAGGRKRRLVARGVQSTLSKTSMLANFLPTGTPLTFEMLLPAASGDGTCSAVSVAMLRALLALCAASCFLSHFTDSFRAPDGKGRARRRGSQGGEVPARLRRRRARGHVVLVFAAVALADYRVSGCLVAGHRKEMDEVMESCPLMVGTVCSGLFLVFPNTRYGIGCLAA